MIPSVECVNLDLHDRAEKAEAEVARLKELQPCGHPVQAIRSTPYIGDQHSNYCGWCADVEHEHELCQTLTAELLAYREKVARLREALDKVRAERETAQSQLIAARERLIDISNQAVMELPATEDTNRETLEWIIRRAKVDFDLLKEDESWLERHDEEVRGEMLGYILDALPQLVEWGQPRENLGVADVNAIIRRTLQKARAQERERCQWVALEHNAPELIEAARIIAAAIRETPAE